MQRGPAAAATGPIHSQTGEKHMAHLVQELQRRLDSGEPIEDTRNWFLKQDGKVWQGYYADQYPLVQWLFSDMMTDFLIWLEQKERPNKPFTEIVLERLTDLRQQGDLMKRTIDRLTELIDI
jgi:hypothetical protein